MEESNFGSAADEERKKKNFTMYLQFWIGQMASLLGSAVVMFALIWQLSLMRPNNNTIISIAYFLGFLPQILVSPFAGVIADKFNKKKIIYISDSLQAFFTLVLIALFWFNKIEVWHILLVNILRGTCQAFQSPISFTLIPLMVPKDKMTRINGLNFLFNSVINVIGPIIGAGLLAILPVQSVLWVDIVTFGIALIPLMIIKIPKAREEEHAAINGEKKKTTIFSEIGEGIKIIKNIKGLPQVILIGVFLNFIFMPIDALGINFIKVVHGGSQIELGFFMGALQIGMFLGAILVTLKKQWHHWYYWVMGSLFMEGILFISLGLIPEEQFWMLYTIAGIFFLLNPVMNSLFQTTIQNIVPPTKIGSISSLLTTLLSIAAPLGLLIAGPIADAVNSINWVFIGSGIMTLIVILVASFGSGLKGLLSRGEATANHYDLPLEEDT